MSHPVRARLRCASVKHFAGDMRIVEMNAVTDSATPKDRQFAKYTPAAKLEMHVDNPAVEFHPGQDYFVDFTPAG